MSADHTALLQLAHKKASKWFTTMPLHVERDKVVAVLLSRGDPAVFIDIAVVAARPQFRLSIFVAPDGEWEDTREALMFLMCENSMIGPGKLLISGGQLRLERLLDVELTSSKRLARAIKSLAEAAARTAHHLHLMDAPREAPE